jgi:sugar phosphate isomerase/epimerase
MFRALPIDEMVRTIAELGYEYIELSPRDDFMRFFLHPRADDERIDQLKNSLRTTVCGCPRCCPCTSGRRPTRRSGRRRSATGSG